jgi:hypothetical protein
MQTLVFKGKSCEFSGGVGEALMLPPEEGDEVEKKRLNNIEVSTERE